MALSVCVCVCVLNGSVRWWTRLWRKNKNPIFGIMQRSTPTHMNVQESGAPYPYWSSNYVHTTQQNAFAFCINILHTWAMSTWILTSMNSSEWCRFSYGSGFSSIFRFRKYFREIYLHVTEREGVCERLRQYVCHCILRFWDFVKMAKLNCWRHDKCLSIIWIKEKKKAPPI